MKKKQTYVAPETSMVVFEAATIIASSVDVEIDEGEDVDNSDKARPFFNPNTLQPWHGNMNRSEWQ